MVNYDSINKIIEEKEIDAMIITNRYNLRYISGFKGDTGMLVLLKNKRYLLTDFRYVFMAMADTKERDYKVIDIADYKGYTGTINHIIESEKIEVIGFENEDVSYTQFMDFRKELKCQKLTELGDVVSKLRVI